MKRPTVTNHNLETNEIETREMNDAEFSQWEIDKAYYQAREQAEAQAEAAKESAQAKLEALGLTANDLKALGL
jgi:hypothetical protein